MKTVSITIDGRHITASEGQTLLWAALANGIFIPNLCAMEDAGEPEASCRLCFVEVEGYAQPVTACTEVVREGMVVNTCGPRALRLARTAAELLLASDPLDCGRCPANRACALQRIAVHLGLKLKSRRLRRLVRDLPVDATSPVFVFDRSRCVLCGRCVWICREREGVGAIGFARRGFRRVVTTFGDDPLAASPCTGCGRCVVACPVGALAFKNRDVPAHVR